MFSSLRTRLLRWFFIAALLGAAIPGSVYGQRLTVGVITGASLTDDFRPATLTVVGSQIRQVSDESDWFMVGPMVELALSKRLSVEVDAIRRRIRSRQAIIFPEPVLLPNGGTLGSFTTIADEFTWQFSTLGKYAVATGNVKPFLESGFTFLPRENRDQTGVTTGSGIELGVWRLNISPALRYTHWLNNDSLGGVRDQFQFVIGVKERSDSVRPRAFGRPLTLGFVAGFGLTKLLRNHSEPAFGFASTSDSTTPVGGLLIRLPLRNHLSVEVNGLYRPTHTIDQTILPDGSLQNGERNAFLTWEAPVLARYEVPLVSKVAPVIELGPSFRAIAHGNSETHSHRGVTGGVGIAARVRSFTVAPTIRYTRWAADRDRFGREPFTATRPNQLELLVEFSF
jgi:hypothetical protein